MQWMVVLGLVACGSSTPPLHGAQTEIATILDAGAAPRRVVRYAYVSGAVGHVERTAKITVTTAVTNTVLETDSKRVDNPTLRWVERTSVGEVSADGAQLTATIMVVGDDVPDGRVLSPLEVMAGQLKGTSTSWTQSARGTISNSTASESDLELPRGVGIVFPDGEIGVGATWRVTSRERVARVMWDQTVTFRLRSLTDTSASVDVDVERRARSQPLSVEPTATINVSSGTAKATGTVNVSLSGLWMVGTSHDASELKLAIVQKALRITMKRQTSGDYSVKEITR